MTKAEIEARKKELEEEIDKATTPEEVDALKEEVEKISKEVPEEPEKEVEPKTEEVEEKSLIRSSEKLDIDLIKKEDKKMEEKKFTRASEEYRSAWAKSLMGLPLTDIEKRAVGDALGTTATTFVAADADHQGVNNLGLLIPTSVVTALLERAAQESPIWRDIRKLYVKGNVDVPWLYAADDAAFYPERTDTNNEGQEFKKVTLVGRELAKDIEITWKADQMTVEGFMAFILDELYEKMFKAKINAVIYGTGSGYNQPAGITNGLSPVTTGDTPIDTIANTKASLTGDAKKGAKVYISSDVADAIRFYKNSEGNYPFLAGLPSGFEEDPFLNNNDIVVGNPRNYVWNEQEPIRVDRDISIKGRKVTYGAYQVVDGGSKDGAFAYGQYTEVSA